MPIVSKSALMPFAAERMFDLVSDVEGYPAFLPWCASAELLSKSDEKLCGRIEVARLGIRQTFSTCNHLQRPERMEIALDEGPFRKLQGAWTFTELGDEACKVELVLEFEFAGGLIDKAFGAVFGQIANTLVDAFCKRAEEVFNE